MKLNRKNKLFLAGLIITLYICYSFAFSNTLQYYRQYSAQKEVAEAKLNNPALLKNLVQKENQLDQILNQYTSASGTSFQNELLTELALLSKKYHLKISDFKEPHVFVEKDLRVSSYIFSVEGSFNEILLAINSIENKASLGFVKHITFTKKMDYKTNSTYLVAEVILQKSESTKNRNKTPD